MVGLGLRLPSAWVEASPFRADSLMGHRQLEPDDAFPILREGRRRSFHLLALFKKAAEMAPADGLLHAHSHRGPM